MVSFGLPDEARSAGTMFGKELVETLVYGADLSGGIETYNRVRDQGMESIDGRVAELVQAGTKEPIAQAFKEAASGTFISELKIRHRLAPA